MGKIGQFQKLIKYASPTHLSLKGGVKMHRKFTAACAQDLREFLQKYKGKHIKAEDIEQYYRTNFPQLNINIIDQKPGVSSLMPGFPAGVRAMQSTKAKEDLTGVESFKIILRSRSLMDKIKDFFHIPHKDKGIYVNTKFIESMVHENTHIVQTYLKPTQLIYAREIFKKADGMDTHIRQMNFDCQWAYRDLVYTENIPLFFTKSTFIKKLMRQLNGPYHAKTRSTSLVNLKMLIREAQAEKEAYDLEAREGRKLRFPRLSKLKFLQKWFNREDNNWFLFDKKIDAMKKEYFKLIEHERQQHAKSLKG